MCESINRRVQEVNLAGRHVRYLGAGVIEGGVECVATTDAAVFVGTASRSSGAAQHVWVFDAVSGLCTRRFGEPGSEPGFLNSCLGIRCSPDGMRIALAEFSNRRLSVFHSNGTYEFTCGAGRMKGPADVLFSRGGDLIAADPSSHCVFVFSAVDGALVHELGQHGSGPGQFQSPIALAVHGSALYVVDENSARVQVFE